MKISNVSKKFAGLSLAAMLVNTTFMTSHANAGILAGAGIIAASWEGHQGREGLEDNDGARIFGTVAGSLVIVGGIAFGSGILAIGCLSTPLLVAGSAFIVLDDQSADALGQELAFLKPAELEDLRQLINSKLAVFQMGDEIKIEVHADEILDIMNKGDYSDAEIETALAYFAAL